MKKLSAVLCLIICIFAFSSCNKTDNSEHFASHLQSSPEELRYMPEIFSDYESVEKIKVSVLADDTVTYSLKDKVTAKSGFEYQNINLHIKKTHKRFKRIH